MVDPFHVVRNQVEQSLSGITSLLSRWRVLLKTVNTSKNEEFLWHTEEIKRAVQTLQWDLQDLEKAVEVSAKDPARFQLTAAEVADRKKLVASLLRQVNSVSSELSSEATQAKLQQDAQQSLFSTRNSNASGGANASAMSADDSHDFNGPPTTAGGMRAQMMVIREREDEQLDELSLHLGGIHEKAVAINTEVDGQIKLLGEVEEQVEYTNTRMGSALRKIDKLLSAAGDKGALFIVIFLILVLIGLIVLVFNV